MDLRPLIAFAARQTGYTPAGPPAVFHIAPQELYRKFENRDWPEDLPVGQIQVGALYVPKTVLGPGAIFLRDDFDESSPEQMALLAHEIVHWLQDVNGTFHAMGVEARERQAEDTQAAWLDDHFREPENCGKPTEAATSPSD